MQHGTGREFVLDIVENVESVLARKGPKDLAAALRLAIEVLEDGHVDLEKRGQYGPDYPSPFGTLREDPFEHDFGKVEE